MSKSEMLIIVCENCAESGMPWLAKHQQKISLRPNRDYNLNEIVDRPNDLLNHHFTVRSYSRGHGQFVILDSDYRPIATLRISSSSQRVSTDRPTLTSAGYKTLTT